MEYFLCLGSNVGKPRRNLAEAIRLLERARLSVVNASSVYRTEPVEVLDQPWFLNQAIEVRTDRTPYELLVLAKAIESRMRRRPLRNKGPRTIDIDILLAGDTIMETPGLTIPHPHLARRNFVLIPLAEIAPCVVHPVLHKTVTELVRMSEDRSAVLKCGKADYSFEAP